MLILKGLIIGLGKIIPGVSGSLLAISLGEYENMLNSVNYYFKDIINNSKYLVKICIGILISIALFSNIIAKSINSFYLYTMFLFAGFIVGSLNVIKKGTETNYLVVFISFLVLLIINKYIFTNNLIINKNFIYYIFGGILDSVTMIIPGISGTALLISYGCYNEVIYSLSNVDLKVLFPFMIGMALGLITTIKFVSYMFYKYKNTSRSVILGISIATIVIMLKKGIENNYNNSILIAIILFILGILISKKMTAILAIK